MGIYCNTLREKDEEEPRTTCRFVNMADDEESVATFSTLPVSPLTSKKVST